MTTSTVTGDVSKPADTAADDRTRLPQLFLPVAVAAVAVLAFLTYAVVTGLPASHALAATAAVAITQVLPGALAWRVVRPRDGWVLEDLVIGFALGTTLAVPTQVVAGLTHQRWLAIVLPLLVTATLLGVPGSRRRIVEARWSAMPWWFTPAVCLTSIGFITQLIGYVRVNKVSWPNGPGAPHVDTYLHQALASQLLTRGPTSWPTVQGEDLGYHWFTHAWIAQVTASSGVSLNEVLVRFLPAIMPVAFVLSVAVVALRLSRKPSVGVLATVIAVMACQGNPFSKPGAGLPLTPESPTLGLGAPTLLALLLVLALRWRGEARRGAIVLVPLLAIVASGTKGSTAPIVVAGLALAAVAMLLWNRALLKPVLIDLAIITVCLGAVMVVVFHGSSAGLAFGTSEAAKQASLAAWLGALPTSSLLWLSGLLALLSGLTRAALVFVLPFSRRGREDPVTWVLLGASVAGAAAVAVFSHPGHSQGYFQLTAIPLAAIGSALGFDKLMTVLGRERVTRLVGLGLVGGFAFSQLPALITGDLARRDFDHAWQMVWIALAGVAVVVLAAWLLARRGYRWVSAGSVLGLSAVLSGFLVFGDGMLQPVRAAVDPVPPTRNLATWQGQIDAARYIRDHSKVDDVVMTNRHCSVPRSPFNGCDSRRWLVTAFSERQSLIEGWTATPRATEIAPHGRDSVTVNYWKPDILRLNDGFIAAPTESARDRLWSMGVRWVFVETDMPHAATLAPYADRRFVAQDGSASAWELQPPR